MARPQTLAELKRRAKKVFGAETHPEIWLHHCEKNGRPDLGHVNIETEAEYSAVGHDDVVCIIADGKKMSLEKFAHLTTAQADYTKMPIVPYERKTMPQAEYQKSKFYGESTHKRDFPQHPLERRALANSHRQEIQKSTAKFDGRTSYQEHFIPKQLPHRTKKVETSQRPEPEPFCHTTTSRAAYTGFSGYPLKSYKPIMKSTKNNLYQMDERKTPMSAYQEHYIKHAHRQITPHASRSPATQTQPTPFEGRSTYQNDFIEKKIHRGRLVHLEPEHSETGLVPVEPKFKKTVNVCG
eukprot:CAMPEP_0185751812 /NCGR_PEP_ID=MMETSP1174-20130828/10600_1 /TAXON_ID=35687 /ORGANISM="Dictyocha speculum, Strain CCMP1381" /LENGTH=295 /DNA_ID=CAMNT_0028428977 /DNA_START=89 /DNA_END=976 /DNA_ORIENTATION=-